MLRTTLGQLVVNEALPEDMRNYERTLDKKGMNDLLRELAQKHPDKYVEVSKKLSDIGRTVATEFGGYSFGLEHLRKSATGLRYQQQLTSRVKQILDNDDLTSDQRKQLIVKAVGSVQQKQIDEIYDEAVKGNNPLAMQVVSGSRGNRMNLASLLGSDLLYADHRDEVIPLPVLSSYSQGLTPIEYWASTYGARRGTMATKFCVSSECRVLMADYSEKPIGDITAGDWVMGSDTCGLSRPVRVVRVHNNGVRPCYRYRFRKGACRDEFLELTATEDHKVLAQIKSQRGVTSQCVRTPTPLPLHRAEMKNDPQRNEYLAWVSRGERGRGVTEPRALLAGLMLGDGCMAPSTKGRYSLSCADSVLLDDVRAYLAAFNLTLSRSCETQYGYNLCEIVRSRRVTSAVSGRNEFVCGQLNGTKRWLKDTLGEKLAHEKTLPDAVWTWDDSAVGDLLGGLFSTDGCVSVRPDGITIQFQLTARQMVEQAQRLLELRLGIWTTGIDVIEASSKRFATHHQYGFRISHPECVKRFAERVRLVGVKRSVLRDALALLSADPTRQEYGCKVYDKKYVGNLPTFDLEVDHPDHLFVLANGLVVSNSTQDAGFLSKQLNQIAHRLVVVDEDDTRNLSDVGLPVDADDLDNEGSLLARDIGPYKRNTVLTPKIVRHIKGLGHDRILVRSPLVGGSPDGGVYARDVGVRERGTLPGRGEQVGLTAAQALSEPLSQGQLSAKHSGGVAGQEKAVGGFAYVNQLIQTPKKFKGGAAHAEFDGHVSAIEEAPAGGQYVWIDSNRHYVPGGVPLKVKKGDEVEAGDVISEGFPHPDVVTKHKGVGEGKRYFVNAFRQAMQNAGMKVHRRNIELLARGLINHVRLTDELGDHVPDDVVPYSTIEHVYEPRADHQSMQVGPAALGKYLERPVLHYSIGTKVRPSVLKELQHFGVGEVSVHTDPPPFQAEMIRGMYSLQNDPDWMTRMYGSGLKESLLDATHRGAVSDELGTSFVPSLARAVEFGRVGSVRQPEAGTQLPPEGQPLGDPRRTTSPALKIQAPAVEKKRPGLFSSLFKSSEDEILKEAAACLAKSVMGIKPVVRVRQTPGTAEQIRGVRLVKQAQGPSVTSTIKPTVGSSTVGADGASKPLAPPPPRAPSPPTPALGPTPNAPAKPAIPPSPGGVAADSNPWPATAPGAAPPGVMHPDRVPGGYSPGQSMMRPDDSPEMLESFVRGGGRDYDSGFGGQFGSVARFGTLLDSNAVSALTGGDYVRNQHGGSAQHDDLIGGNRPELSQQRSGVKPPAWLQNIMTQAGSPGMVQRFEQSQPGSSQPAPQQPGQPGQPMSARPPVSPKAPAAPQYAQQGFAERYGWKPGNAEFDSARNDLAKSRGVAPGAVTDADVQSELWSNAKASAAARRAGYEPGKPQFEALRQQLNDEFKKSVPDPVGTVAGLRKQIADARATNPTDPAVQKEIAEAEEYIKFVERVSRGVDDNTVAATAFERKMFDPNSVDDYVVHESMTDLGRPAAANIARDVVNPGWTAAFSAGGSLAYRGGAALVGRPAAGGLLGGFKKSLGKLPGIGFALEGVDAANMTDQEAMARLNAKLTGQVDTELPFNLGKVRGDTLGGYLLDNAVNPGKNIAAIGVGAREAMHERDRARYGAVDANVSEAAMLTTRLAQASKGQTAYTPVQLARDRARLEELNRTHGGDMRRNFASEVDKRLAANADRQRDERMRDPASEEAQRAARAQKTEEWRRTGIPSQLAQVPPSPEVNPGSYGAVIGGVEGEIARRAERPGEETPSTEAVSYYENLINYARTPEGASAVPPEDLEKMIRHVESMRRQLGLPVSQAPTPRQKAGVDRAAAGLAMLGRAAAVLSGVSQGSNV